MKRNFENSFDIFFVTRFYEFMKEEIEVFYPAMINYIFRMSKIRARPSSCATSFYNTRFVTWQNDNLLQ